MNREDAARHLIHLAALLNIPLTAPQRTALVAIIRTEHGPIWETCRRCGNDYQWPHLCRAHMLCGLCHAAKEKENFVADFSRDGDEAGHPRLSVPLPPAFGIIGWLPSPVILAGPDSSSPVLIWPAGISGVVV